jgi:Protein of unknown function (DUF2889)
MPLSEIAQPRELLHSRDIRLRGFRRADGLFDVEAELQDTKTYGFSNADRGWIAPGEPLHHMCARMTVDEDMLIVAFEAATEAGPYTICPQAAPNFARLAGLRIGRGFLKAANERVGGTAGCTHLRELLQPMATVAFQTLYAVRAKRREAAANAEATAETPQASSKPALLGTCLAYAPDSPVVKRNWPHAYTGS